MPSFLHDMRVDAARRAAALRERRGGGTTVVDGRPRRSSYPDPAAVGRTVRSLSAAVRRRDGAGPSRLIAEIKRRSPSAGELRPSLDAGELARIYVDAGAAAISVLTEPERFGGSLRDLEVVARVTRVPVLRKDFLVDPIQLWESREAGADAVLLIVRMLEDSALFELLDAARQEGLEALVEVHGIEELARALNAGAELVGVNNRNLETLTTDAGHALALAREIGERRLGWPKIAVSESGIRTRRQVLALEMAGYDAVLVGESLLRATDPACAVRELIGDTPLPAAGA